MDCPHATWIKACWGDFRQSPFLLISHPFPPQAADFRQFWGSRSELRRFQDGAIREAVVWEAASMAQKRLIPHQVVTHLLAL